MFFKPSQQARRALAARDGPQGKETQVLLEVRQAEEVRAKGNG